MHRSTAGVRWYPNGIHSSPSYAFFSSHLRRCSTKPPQSRVRTPRPPTAPSTRREVTLQFPSAETGPITGRAVVGAHHQGSRLAEELRLNHPNRPQPAQTIQDASDPSIARDYARSKGVSTRWMWDQRNQLFAAVNRKFLTVLTSHLDAIEKASRIAELYRSEVKLNAIQLRLQTYEDIFECLLAIPRGEVQGADTPLRRHMHTDLLFDMYHFMKGGFSAPSPKIVEYLMFSISYSARTSPQSAPELTESRAHKLWLDVDRYSITASRYTYTYYFEVCALYNIMHIALSRYIDAKERLGIQPDEAMCTTIIRGFVRNDQVEEAISFISTMYAVPVDCFLLDAVVECFAESTDPLAAFSVFRSQMERSGLHPTPFTFHYLMKACEKSGDFRETMFVMQQMMTRSIQGTHVTLNLILKGLILLKKHALAEKLYLRLRRREVPIWDKVLEQIPEKVKHRGTRAHDIAKVTKDTRERLLNDFDKHYAQLTQWGENGGHGVSGGDRDTPAKPLFAPPTGEKFPLTPQSEAHLRDFVVLGRIQWVSLEYLCEFLCNHGIALVAHKPNGKEVKRHPPTAKRLAYFCRNSPGLKRKLYRLVKAHFFPEKESVDGENLEQVSFTETHGTETSKSVNRPEKISVIGMENASLR